MTTPTDENDERPAARLHEKLFRQYWVEDRSITDIAEERGITRQAISDELARKGIKTYYNLVYSPKGILHWDFNEDSFFLTENQKTCDIEGTYEKELVIQRGPIEIAKAIESETLEVDVQEDRIWKAILWAWDHWDECLTCDPLPRWVLARAIDALGMNQKEFASFVGFAPRTIRKWINSGKSTQPCTGESREKVARRITDRTGSDDLE